jgi:hypothetical protein
MWQERHWSSSVSLICGFYFQTRPSAPAALSHRAHLTSFSNSLFMNPKTPPHPKNSSSLFIKCYPRLAPKVISTNQLPICHNWLANCSVISTSLDSWSQTEGLPWKRACVEPSASHWTSSRTWQTWRFCSQLSTCLSSMLPIVSFPRIHLLNNSITCMVINDRSMFS